MKKAFTFDGKWVHRILYTDSLKEILAVMEQNLMWYEKINDEWIISISDEWEYGWDLIEGFFNDLQIAMFEDEGLKWKDFHKVYIHVMQKGKKWEDHPDACLRIDDLKERYWSIKKGVNTIYDMVYMPYMDAYSAMKDIIESSPERLSREEMKACGMLIKPHDEIRLIFTPNPQ